MLVATNDTRMPVGIVVCEWNNYGDIQQFVILPFEEKGNMLVDVEYSGSTEVISPAMPEWASTKVGFGDKSKGYPMDEATIKDLYLVWDDGSCMSPEASMRLYTAFAEIIEYYNNDANKYLEDLAKEQYDQAINEAKKNGWDVELIKFEKQTFPYCAQN